MSNMKKMSREVHTINISKVSTITNLFYLFFHGGKAAIIPFLTLFFRLLGLNALEAGTIIAAKTLTGMVWAPLWARCATRCSRHRAVLLVSIFMMVATYLVFPALYTQLGTMADCPVTSTNGSSVLQQSFHPSTKPSTVSSIENSSVSLLNTENLTSTLSTTTVIESLEPSEASPTEQAPISTSPENVSTTAQMSEEQREILQKMMSLLVENNLSAEEAVSVAGLNLTHSEMAQLKEMMKEGKHKMVKRRLTLINSTNWAEMQDDFRNRFESIQRTLRDDRVLLFLVLLAIMVVGEIFASPVEKVADDAWFDFLNRIDDLERYGQQRFWGSVAFVMVPIAVTVAVDNTPCFLPYHLHHFLIHFYVFVVLMALALIVACWYPVPPPANNKYSSKICKGIRVICCDGRGFLFSITLLLTGMVYASYHNFLFWRIQDLKGKEMVMGLCVSVGAFAEIPMLIFSSRFVKKMGHCWVVSLSLLILSLRVIYYAFVPTPWAFVPMELTHGFTHTALWFAILSYEEFNVNAALDRSLRSILSSFYFGIGFSTGSVLSGYISDNYGFPNLFIGCSAVVGVWCVLFFLFQKCLPKKDKIRYIKLLRSDSDVSDEEEDDWLEMAMKDH